MDYERKNNKNTADNKHIAVRWTKCFRLKFIREFQHCCSLGIFCRQSRPNGNMQNVVSKLKSQPHKQHIWFLPTRKPTQKNQKSCFLPTLEEKLNEKRKPVKKEIKGIVFLGILNQPKKYGVNKK